MADRAVVVGGSSAIGSAIAGELAAAGYEVELWGRDEARLAAGASGSRLRTRTADVTDLVSLEAAFADLEREGGDLRAVVFAAGIFDWAPVEEADPRVSASVIETDLTGAVLTARLALPMLIDAAPSALILIGSGAAHEAFPNNAAYVAAKHGLAGFARATFLEVRDRDVKVSLISPGLVAAGSGLQSPAGRSAPERLLAPEDVAAAVRYVVDSPARACPVEIRLQPQRTP